MKFDCRACSNMMNFTDLAELGYALFATSYVQSFMNTIDQLFLPLKLEANVFHNGQYCGAWAIDVSGSEKMTFHVVVRGSCYLNFNNQLTKLTVGDAIFLPSDAKHIITNLPEQEILLNQADTLPMQAVLTEPSTGLVCGNFGHEHPLFDRLMQQLPEVIIVRRAEGSACAKIIDVIIDESARSGVESSLLLNRLSDCLFFSMVREHADHDSGVFAALAHEKLSRAMTLIHQKTESAISLDVLAEAAGMSRSAFSSLFKSLVGLSPMDYLKQWRMTLAYRWLTDDGVSTYEAALRSGYESESSFSKAFSSVMGFGPGKARAKQR